MNQTFSLTRFGRLLRKYFTDNRGQLGANLALLTVVLMNLRNPPAWQVVMS